MKRNTKQTVNRVILCGLSEEGKNKSGCGNYGRQITDQLEADLPNDQTNLTVERSELYESEFPVIEGI